MSTVVLLLAMWFTFPSQHGNSRSFGDAMMSAPRSERIHRAITRIQGLQNVPLTNVYGFFNADTTKFVAIVIKDSTQSADGQGWYYNMRAVHGVIMNFKMYTAPQVFASQDSAREGAIATVVHHIGKGYGSDTFWSAGMFLPSNSEKVLDEDVTAALQKYPKWGAFPSWVVKQVAKEF